VALLADFWRIPRTGATRAGVRPAWTTGSCGRSRSGGTTGGRGRGV